MGELSLNAVLNKENSNYDKNIYVLIKTYKLALELIQQNPDLLNIKNAKRNKNQKYD